MDFEITDLAGISKPLEKLIDEVSKGIGTLYRPRAIRNEGAAEAARVKAIELAKAEASEQSKTIALSGTLGRLSALVGEDPELLERAKLRLVQREIEGQVNIEQIADSAIKYLPQGDPSPEPLSDDWRRKFFKHAEDVSEETLQDMWARILAGEIAQPRTFSVRTLDVLAALSTEEAALFRHFLTMSFAGQLYGVPQLVGPGVNEKMPGFTYDTLMLLQDAGLIHSVDPIQMSWQPAPNDVIQCFEHVSGTQMIVFVPKDKVLPAIQYVALSKPGIDLQKVSSCDVHYGHLGAIARRIRAQGFRVIFGGPDANHPMLHESADSQQQ